MSSEFDYGPHPNPESLAEAAQRRNATVGRATSESQLHQHEQQQMFRRLINPGIYRPNSPEAAMASLKTLSTIAENLIREPENPKFRQFKPTNNVIRRHLVETKGALEYAVAMGFHAQVKDFQPLYIWNEHRGQELRIGAQILREAIDLAEEKLVRSRRNAAEAKAANEAARKNVLLAAMDDRRTKRLRDERDRLTREALAGKPSRIDEAAVSPSDSPSPHTEMEMPGRGYTLSSFDSVVDEPPSYHD